MSGVDLFNIIMGRKVIHDDPVKQIKHIKPRKKKEFLINLNNPEWNSLNKEIFTT